jgi:hypothetical protein
MLVAAPLIFWPYRYVVFVADSGLKVRWLLLEKVVRLQEIFSVDLLPTAARGNWRSSYQILRIRLLSGRSIELQAEAAQLAGIRDAILRVREMKINADSRDSNRTDPCQAT